MSARGEQLRKAAALAAEGKTVAVITRSLREARRISEGIEAVNPDAVSGPCLGSLTPAVRYKSGGVVLLLTYRGIDGLRGYRISYLLTETGLTRSEHEFVAPAFLPGRPCIEVLEQ